MNVRLLAVFLLALLVPVAASAAAPDTAPAPAVIETPATAEPAAAVAEFRLPSLQIGDILFAASGSSHDGNPLRKNQLRSNGVKNALCEWFVITCSGGGGDTCCGSVNSCLGYCSELCGGPCIYVET